MTTRLDVSAAPRACVAGEVQLFFRPDGEIRACCRNERALGHVTDGVMATWTGDRRRALVDALSAGTYDLGCEACGNEVRLEGRPASYPATFDEWAPAVDRPRWPALLDFNLSIACNLQCIQCNGEQSSAIRIHRERRPPLASPYADSFYEEIRPFLRHARLARFAGGEPFLAPENHRVWELIAEEAPDLLSVVITNATVFNDRVEAAMRSVRMGFVLSIDGATAATYEAVRVGADFDEVMRNVVRFRDHARTASTPISVNHCLMVQNHHEFADLLLWAESLGLRVDVSVVRDPHHCSIARLPAERAREVHREMERRRSDVEGRLQLNRATWEREVTRIGRWAELDDHERRQLWGDAGRMVLMFKCEGIGPHDDAAAIRDIRAHVGDGVTTTVTVDHHQTIVDCSGRLDVFGLAPDDLLGRPVAELPQILGTTLGPHRDQRVIAESPDRVDLEFRLGAVAVRATIAALRDEGGWADRARIVLGVTSDALAKI